MKAEQSRAPYYFQFHMGDYLRDAQELSMLQHGAYLQLMLWYYSTSRPIPNDLERIYRRTGAYSREEKRAVEEVLAEFFMLVDNFWKHKRIDQELEKYSTNSEVSRNAANVRWGKQKINKINETTYADAMQTQCERNANQNQNQNPIKKPSVSCSVKPNYTPLAREILNFLNEKTGKRFRDVPANITPIVARLKEGFTDRHFRIVIARKVREWGTDEKMMGYLRPKTLFNATNFSQYAAEVPDEVS